MSAPSELVVYEEFGALRVEGYDDGSSFAGAATSYVRIGFAAVADDMAVLQVYAGDFFAEVLLTMDTLRYMSAELGHLAHGR